MVYTEKELLNKKEEVNAAKTTVSELTGQKQAVIKQLKEDWKCDNIGQAKALINTFDLQLASYDKKIEKGSLELQKLLEPEKEKE